MADRAQVPVDPLIWWQDKQVAVIVGTNVVRGWVLTASSHPSADEASPIGHLTIVLFIGSETLAREYPSEVTVVVHSGGQHGRPHRVLGLWNEEDLTDVRARYASAGPSIPKAQVPTAALHH